MAIQEDQEKPRKSIMMPKIVARLREDEKMQDDLPRAVEFSRKLLTYVGLIWSVGLLFLVGTSVGVALLLQDRVYPWLYSWFDIRSGETLTSTVLRWVAGSSSHAFFGLLVLVSVAGGLYVVRWWRLGVYALLEMIVGLEMIVLMLLKGNDTKAGLTIISGVYLLVRALDNMAEATGTKSLLALRAKKKSRRTPEEFERQLREHWPTDRGPEAAFESDDSG